MTTHHKKFLFIFIALITLACGKTSERATLIKKATSHPQYDGMISQINGEIVQISNEEAEIHCQNNFCEPNYIYTTGLGPSKPIPPGTSPGGNVPLPPPLPATPGPNKLRNPGPIPAQGTEVSDYSRALLKINEAWNKTQGDSSIIVAVIDSGVDVLNHDLKNNIWINEKEFNGKNDFDDDGNGFKDDIYGYDFTRNKGNGVDDNNHGTHCAGIIAAEVNGIGTVGVAPKVKIMPLKFLNSSGSGNAQNAVKAFRYAIDNGAQVISNSWSGTGASKFLNDIIQEAISKGIYVVAAASNEDNDNDAAPMYPANYPNVIAVGSTDSKDNKSSFSNYGKKSVFIAAPGSEIYSTILDGKYAAFNGTSMATPQVAGALALALSLENKIALPIVKNKLCETSRKILLDKFMCGRMNVKAFIDSLIVN